MNSKLMVFEEKKVEVFEVNGIIYFNPYDVGECLGLSETSIPKLLSRMNKKQVVKLKNADVTNCHIQNSDVGLTNIRKLNNAGENFLTESGVYKLIFRSNKPNAEKFTDWVTDEVLPSIRKEGAYITDNANPESLREKANELEKLDTINKSLELVSPLLDSAGVDNNIKLLITKTFFEKAGINIPIEIEAEESYYDTKQIGNMIGMYSKTGKPAFGAVGEVIKKLDVDENEKKAVWESNGSWQGTVIKYTQAVVDKVVQWLKENNYPTDIPSKNRTFHVVYKSLEEVVSC